MLTDQAPPLCRIIPWLHHYGATPDMIWRMVMTCQRMRDYHREMALKFAVMPGAQPIIGGMNRMHHEVERKQWTALQRTLSAVYADRTWGTPDYIAP